MGVWDIVWDIVPSRVQGQSQRRSPYVCPLHSSIVSIRLGGSSCFCVFPSTTYTVFNDIRNLQK